MGVLQEARLEAISTIGRLAIEHAAPIVLVAGDIYDVATAEDRTLAQPIARMRAFGSVEWHLIPGNHDPHQPGGPWNRLLRRGLPANVRVHLEPAPRRARRWPGALLPAPLARRRTLTDPTAWMDQAPTPEATLPDRARSWLDQRLRVGCPQPAEPDRPDAPGARRPRYLALGDWHGTKRIGPRCWYSGTPEVDDFGVVDGGHALLVELAGPGAPPEVTRCRPDASTGAEETVHIHGEDDVDVVTARLRALHEDPACLLLDLHLEGTLSLAGRERLARALDDVGAALRFLRVDDGRLYLSPSADDLEAIARGGFVRVAAESLRAMADDPDEPARELAGPGAAAALCRAPQAERAMKLRALELEQFRKFDRPDPDRRHGRWPESGRRPQRDGQVDAVRGPAGGPVRAPPLAGPDGQELPAGRPRGRLAARRPAVRGRRPALSDREALPATAERRARAARRPPSARRGRRGGARCPARGRRRRPGRRRRSAAEALGIWSLLWVGQGQSFALPEIAPARAARCNRSWMPRSARSWRRSRQRADRRAGQALHELVYKAGRPRGRYKEADDARQAPGGSRSRISKPGGRSSSGT